jgi:hypothetical protein
MVHPVPQVVRRVTFRLALLAALVGGVVLASGSAAAPRAPRQIAPAFPGGPYFVLVCGSSHRNSDDPIVFPGQPGRSHNHTFIGNRTVDAFTTPTSLRGGPTTCEMDADSSTYWVPTLFAGREAVTPFVGLVYYTRRTPERVVAFPADLKMVAGNQHARKPQSKNILFWTCGGLGATARFAAVPSCGQSRALQLRVHFPSCWNGKTGDSADHKRHVAYPSGGRCPATHPVAVPTLTLILLYPPVPKSATVASGKFGAHADFMNGWDQAELERLVADLNY